MVAYKILNLGSGILFIKKQIRKTKIHSQLFKKMFILFYNNLVTIIVLKNLNYSFSVRFSLSGLGKESTHWIKFSTLDKIFHE